MYKNIEKQTSLRLKDLVNYQDGQVVSKTLVQNEHVSMTIFSSTTARKSPPTQRAETPWSQCWMAQDESLLAARLSC